MSDVQRVLDEVYRVQTLWTPEHAASVLDHHAWVLADCLATLEIQRAGAHRYLANRAVEMRARRVGTPEERAEALARARASVDAEVNRRQALLTDVHRVHTQEG